MSPGLFIVLEGVDGAGTTTQVAQLAAALRERRCSVRETREPSGGPIGALLRQCLTGRLVTPGPSGPRAPGWQTMALLFAADRLDHVEAEIDPLLQQGVCVISDRYYHSSVAYQALTSNEDLASSIPWIRSLNARARRPDLTLVLDVSAEQAAERRRLRGGVELYDADLLQAQLVTFYAQLERHFEGEAIVHVSGEGTIEQVASAVLAALDARHRT
jgi:dTMP kinase